MCEKFCDNLKKARLDRELTQFEISSLLGVAKSTYSMYESGHREPNIRTVKKISDILNVSVSQLYGLEEKENNIKIEEYNIASLFSGSDKIFYDILNDTLKKEQIEEINRKLLDRLHSYSCKNSKIIEKLQTDEYTEEELKKIKEYAAFIKSQRKVDKPTE